MSYSVTLTDQGSSSNLVNSAPMSNTKRQRYYSGHSANSLKEDPCSVAYESSSAVRTPSIKSSKVQARKSRVSKFRRAKKAFAASLKKLFCVGAKPSSESKRLSRQSSMRSRRASVRMTSNQPSVFITEPTIKGRNRIQSFGGSATKRVTMSHNVRFSHPAVQSILKPPSTASLPSIVTDDEAEKLEKNSSRASTDSQVSLPDSLAFPASSSRLLRPNAVFRRSCQSVNFEGARESYDEFKARLDGHTGRLDRKFVNDRPPSLGFITRMPTLRMDFSPLMSHTSSAINENDNVEQHRIQALDALEGALPAQRNSTSATIVPNASLSASTTPTNHHQHPTSLLPQRYPRSLIPGADDKQQPHKHHTSPAQYQPHRTSNHIHPTPEQKGKLALDPSLHHALEVLRSNHAALLSTPHSAHRTTSTTPLSSLHLATPCPLPRKQATTITLPSKDKKVAPLNMANSSYPHLAPDCDRTPFHAEPKYQRRSVDVVEAKFVKEQQQAQKKRQGRIVGGGEEKKAGKLFKAGNAGKVARQREREREAEVRKVERGIRKIMGF